MLNFKFYFFYFLEREEADGFILVLSRKRRRKKKLKRRSWMTCLRLLLVSPKYPLVRALYYISSLVWVEICCLFRCFCIELMWYWILVVWLGVDPKSIVCEFFKVGQCTKGFKCKFSHDLNVQRKGEKIDIYSDKRDEGEWLTFLFSTSHMLSFHTFLLLRLKFFLRNDGGLGSRDVGEGCRVKKERV